MKRIVQNLPVVIAGMLLISGASAATLLHSSDLNPERPDRIGGLKLWLSADSIPGSDGDTVSTWSDRSGNGNDMTSGAGPTLRTNALDGKAVLDFTTSETLENTSLSLPSTWTVIYAARLTGDSNNRILQAVGNNWLLGTWDQHVNSAWYGGDIHLVGDPADTAWRIYEGESDGTTAYFYSDGRLIATSTTYIAPPVGGLGLNVGAANEPSTMQVAEIAAYNTALSDADRIELENYFHNKYGIPIERTTSVVLNDRPYTNEPPLSGLIGHWSFDAGTVADSTAHDSAGSDDGVIYGSTTPTPGKLGQALSFDGGSSYVDLPVSVALPALTVSVWFNAASLTGGNPRLLANAHTDSDATGFQLMFNGGGSSGFFDVGNGSDEGQAAWNEQLQTGVWYNYVGTYDGTTVRAYLNGVKVGSAPFSGSIAPSGDVSVGDNIAYGGDHFDGAIDDVRIYDRALSPQEVRELYTGSATVDASRNAKLTDGLSALWSFDGADIDWSTLTVRDGSGNGNDGTMSGMDKRTSPTVGKIGQALRFENGAYVATGYTIPAQNSSSSFTWVAWMKLDPGNSGTAVILGYRGSPGTLSWIKLTPASFEYNDGPKMSETILPNQWVQTVIVKDRENFSYYLNDSLVGSATDSDPADSGTFYIGGDPNFPDDGTFHGSLDDVRVYNRALSVGEIRALYLMGNH